MDKLIKKNEYIIILFINLLIVLINGQRFQFIRPQQQYQIQTQQYQQIPQRGEFITIEQTNSEPIINSYETSYEQPFQTSYQQQQQQQQQLYQRQPQQSPCPDKFQYGLNGNEWYGILQVASPTIGQTLRIQLQLSLAAQLSTNYVGALELYGTKEEAIQNILKQKPVRYRVRFPLPSPAPKLVSIQYNNQIICSGPPDRGQYVTSIRLDHTLHTEVPPNIQLHSQPDISSFGGDDSLTNFVQANNLGPQQPQQPQQPPPQQQPPQTQFVYQNQPQTTTQAYIPTTSTTSAPQFQDTFANTSPIQCGTIDKQFKTTALIIGGEGTKRGTWPWITAIFSNKASTIQFMCGGTLISQQTVLTAAHCLKVDGKRFKESEVIVFVGRHDIKKWGEEGAEAADAQKLLIHPEYSKGRDFEADIGIIILAKEIKYNVYIRPICMWPEGFNDIRDVVGKTGVVVGWGRDETGQLTTPEPKQTQMPIVDELTCLRSDKGFQDLTSNRTFCAGNRDKTGPCNGDSGSGLVIYQNNRWMLRGIVSIAQSNYLTHSCNLDLYIVFTDVAKFIPWIKSNME